MRKLFMAARLPPQDVELLDKLARMGAAKDRSDALRRIISAYRLAAAIMSVTEEPGPPPTCPKCGGRLVSVIETDEVKPNELVCVRCGARYQLKAKDDDEGKGSGSP